MCLYGGGGKIEHTKTGEKSDFEVIHTNEDGIPNDKAEKTSKEEGTSNATPVGEVGEKKEEEQGTYIYGHRHEIGHHGCIAETSDNGGQEGRQAVKRDVDGKLVAEECVPFRVLESLDALLPGEGF